MIFTDTSILNGKKLYFDMDDTLIDTQGVYNQINKKCCSIVQAHSSEPIETETIFKKKTEIDLVNIKRMGFSPERLPTTWKETFRYFVPDGSKVAEDEIVEQAKQTFTAIAPLFEHTEKVLNAAKLIAKELHLFTAGDVQIQQKRLTDSGLSHLFDGVHIVPMKTPDVMRTVISEPSQSIMIGNSLKSDIMPALENSIQAIHIERKTWDYDNQQINQEDANYILLENLSDLFTI